MVYLLNKVDDLIVGRRTDAETSFTVSNVQLGIPVTDSTNGSTTFTPKKIYPIPPHGTADNHFSGEHVLDYAGKKGFGLTLTTRRDRIPARIKQFCHHLKEQLKGVALRRAKQMKYEQPIVATKEVEADLETGDKAYVKTHVSFQSTGCTNISGVNNLPSVSLYVTQKSRGRGEMKRVWGIEQNEARQTYLSFYWAVDNLDHMIQEARIRFISWKYWHAPYLHCMAMVVVAAYDMYKECCEGKLDAEWYVPEGQRMDFRKFRLLLSEQMLEYDPTDNKYPGDDKFRVVTQQPKKRRKSQSTGSASVSSDGVTAESLNAAKSGRICTTIDKFETHCQSMFIVSNANPCEVCGKKTLWRCGLCGNKPVCVLQNKTWKGGSCICRLHNESFFGLTRSDKEDVHNGKKVQWRPPSAATIRRNKTLIRNINEVGQESL